MKVIPSSDVLVAAIERASSLDALVDDLGLRKVRPRTLRRTLEDAWKQRPGEPEVPDELLPCSVVRRNGVEYRIHGIAHGQRRLVRLSDPVRTAVAASVAAWRVRPSGVALERGMAKVFGLDESLDMRYSKALLQRVGIGALLRAALVLPLLPLAPILLLLSRDRLTKQLRQAMRDPTQIAELHARYLWEQLPSAIRIDLDRRGGDRFRVAHSECQADVLVERAEGSGVSVMHALVGLGHEADLVYLLASGNDDHHARAKRR
jgi:hypothetical protein